MKIFIGNLHIEKKVPAKNFEKFSKSIDQTNLTNVVINNGHPKKHL